MSTSFPKGLALVLILLGLAIALGAAVAAVVTDDRSLTRVTAVGCLVQGAGWWLHRRRMGGAQ